MKIQTSDRFQHWIKTNKYLIGFIILLLIALAVIGSWKISPFFVLNFIPSSILTIGIIWALYIGKKGASLLVGGAFLAWMALIAWLSFISHKEFEPSFLSIAIACTLLSLFFVLFGVRIYIKSPKG